LSSHALATLKFEVELQVKYHLCDCSTNDGCGCCDGYAGELEDAGDPMKLPTACQPAPCDIDNSNKAKGWDCKCKPEYSGSIYWEGATPKGTCTVAPCEVDNSDKQPGPQCRCEDGYYGNITWRNSSAEGPCLPAPCKALIPNSTGRGTDCKCKSGYAGQISGVLEGAILDLRVGSECLWGWDCFQAFVVLAWLVSKERSPGMARMRKDGFEATWEDDGTQTLEKDILVTLCGEVQEQYQTVSPMTAEGDTPLERVRIVAARPAPCDIEGSNFQKGPDCSCADGFSGSVRWFKDESRGVCKPAPCSIQNSNMEPGTRCRCKPGFEGNITWQGPTVSGRCEPVA
ncbi:GALNT12, partial [Symbiodinium necroappetens]